MTKLLGKLKQLLFFLVVIYLIGLGVAIVFLYLKIDTPSSQPASSQNIKSELPSDALGQQLDTQTTLSCSQYCKQEIQGIVDQAIATLSSTTKETVVEKQTVVTQVSGGSDFIPMGSTFSTTSTDWVDVPDSVVFFDLINDYGEDATVSWEASLKVAHANGKAFARLYDGTHNIAVDYSEITSENNSEFERVTTGNLPFWRGHNLYKVQIKSLNSFEVTYSGGKIKVSY